jgi:hypothetical protein
MLFGYVLPGGYTLASHSGSAFDLVSSSYTALFDGRPGVKTLFKQTGSVSSQTLTLSFSFGGLPQAEWLKPYPYLLLGVVNIGNYPDEDGAVSSGQFTPSVAFTVNGRWSGGGTKTSQAVVGDSGYSSAWAVIRKNEISGGSTTNQLQVALTGVFNTGSATTYGHFGIGQIVICGADYLPLRSISRGIGGLTSVARSSSNVPWPMARRAFRTLSGTLRPEPRDATFIARDGNCRTYSAMAMLAARKGACVVAPFWRDPGTQGPNLATLNATAMMARMVASPPMLSGAAAEDQFAGTFAFEELL